MTSAVKSRPNHYEVLGLAPSASAEEIAAAFAARMGLFGARPWAAAAELSLAFETLRDPAKRRAYDSAIGLRREPEPQAQPRGWTMVPPQRSAVTFARAAPERVERAVAPPPLATVEPSPSEARAEPAQPEARAEPPPSIAPPEPAPEPSRAPEPIAAWSAPRFYERERSTQLKHAAVVVGVLVLAAGGVGIAAGWPAGGEADEAAGVTVPLPGARPKANTAALDPSTAVPVEQRTEESAQAKQPVQVEQPVRMEGAEAPPEPVSVTPPRIAAADPRPTGRIESIANALVDSGSAAPDGVAEAPPAEAAAADLPLPKSVIARTIDRIGFSCGSVASASAVDGAPGVFRIDCSSGQSYRAAPVHGRYHFRRWSGN